MRTFRTYCGVPALCESCRRVAVANVLETPPRCPDCRGPVRPYTEAALRGPSPVDARVIFSWRIDGDLAGVSLPDAAYLCPRCGQMQMRLEEAGYWD
jgi:hypothetical protein